MAHGQGGAEIRQDGVPTLTCNHEAPIVVHGRQDPCVSYQAYGVDTEGSGNTNVILSGLQIRRLLPLECERLQGMPDDHTRIPWRGKPADRCPDAPRYKAIGNAMAVPVMRWIGRRIQQCLEPLSPVS
nr:DNA cytosine methyltransferase [uncultured Cardiobacterium sp.]